MRACTAALVELSYNEDPNGSPYTGEVEFVSVAEWEKELDLLFDDLTMQDGRAILNVSDPEAHNYVSWCKVVAVYGDTYTHSTERVSVDGRMVLELIRTPCEFTSTPCESIRTPCKLTHTPCGLTCTPCKLTGTPCELTRIPCPRSH
jgi:hypothetical protein